MFIVSIKCTISRVHSFLEVHLEKVYSNAGSASEKRTNLVVLHFAARTSERSLCDENNLLQSMLGIIGNGMCGSSHSSALPMLCIKAQQDYDP